VYLAPLRAVARDQDVPDARPAAHRHELATSEGDVEQDVIVIPAVGGPLGVVGPADAIRGAQPPAPIANGNVNALLLATSSRLGSWRGSKAGGDDDEKCQDSGKV
jgi:hypothetical protein